MRLSTAVVSAPSSHQPLRRSLLRTRGNSQQDRIEYYILCYFNTRFDKTGIENLLRRRLVRVRVSLTLSKRQHFATLAITCTHVRTFKVLYYKSARNERISRICFEYCLSLYRCSKINRRNITMLYYIIPDPFNSSIYPYDNITHV